MPTENLSSLSLILKELSTLKKMMEKMTIFVLFDTKIISAGHGLPGASRQKTQSVTPQA